MEKYPLFADIISHEKTFVNSFAGIFPYRSLTAVINCRSGMQVCRAYSGVLREQTKNKEVSAYGERHT